jgi:methionyl-tRNA formyltransferase
VNVVFCGNPDFALFALDALLASPHHVLAAVCSPDRPRGRGRQESALPVKTRAVQIGIPVLQPEKLSDPAFLNQVRDLNPDCLVVVAFRILPRELFGMPRFGSFNIHPSLLPRYRGPAPIRWTLINGDPETGVSIIQLTEKIDGGGILAQQQSIISPTENYGALHDRLGVLGAQMLIEVLDRNENGQILERIIQDENAVSRAPKLLATDFRLHWNVAREEILNRIRAFSPDPGALVEWEYGSLKIMRATPSEIFVENPGQIMISRDELHVGTASGTIRLEEIKPAGKRAMSTADFLRGRPLLPERFE